MDPSVRDSLERLARAPAVRVEYQCGACGFLLYRRLTRREVRELLEGKGAARSLSCPACGEGSVALVEAASEREWTRRHRECIS